MAGIEALEQVALADSDRLADLADGVAEVGLAGELGDPLLLAVQLDVLAVSVLIWSREAAELAVDLEGGDRRAVAEELARVATAGLATLMQRVREVATELVEGTAARLAEGGGVHLGGLEGHVEVVAGSRFIEGWAFGDVP